MRKLPRHTHTADELPNAEYNQNPVVSLFQIPIMDWAHMAFDTWNEFVAGITLTAQQIIDTIGSVIKSIYDAGAVAWANLATAVQTTINNAAAWIGTILETIKTAGNVAWTSLASAVQTTINNAGAWIGTIIENIKNAGNVATSYLSGVISSANTALSSLADGIFTGASGLAKFVAGFFTADATGRGKFASLFVTDAMINDLNATKINAGSLSADRIATESLVVGKLTEAARAALYPSDNLVFNGDFEDDINADGIPDGWGSNATISSTYSQNGKYSMKIHSDSDYKLARQTVYVELSELSNYVLTFWYRINTGSSTSMFPCILCYDQNKTYLNVLYTGVPTSTTTWTFYASVVSSFPAGTRFIIIDFEVSVGGGVKDYYIDDVKFFRQIDASAMLQDAIIGTAKIADLAVTNAKIGNLAVDVGKIADLAVTNLKIANQTIEFAKTSITFSKDTYLDKTSILVGVDSLLGYSTYGYVASAHGSFTLKKSFVQATIFGAGGLEQSYIWGYKIQSASTNPRVKFKVVVIMTTIADYADIGLREIDDNGTLHGNGAWVHFIRNADSTLTINGVCASGTYQNEMVLQTFVSGTEYTIEIKINSGTSATFFVNGVEKGTLSGYAPTGTLCDFYNYICAHASAMIVSTIKKWKLTDDW